MSSWIKCSVLLLCLGLYGCRTMRPIEVGDCSVDLDPYTGERYDSCIEQYYIKEVSVGKSNRRIEEDSRDMTSGKKNFRRSLVDKNKEKRYNSLLSDMHKDMDLKEIEDAWDELE